MRRLEASGDSLFELFVLLFVEAGERVLRRGLLSGYVEREDALPMARGRILGDRQVLERFGQLDRIICRFDELEHDVVENRLLCAALRVASPRVTSAELRRARVRSGRHLPDVPLCVCPRGGGIECGADVPAAVSGDG